MTFAINDHVERNPVMVPVHQMADWRRQYPGGRRGTVIGIDAQFDARPYLVRWDDNHAEAYYRADDLLHVDVSAQASLFEVMA
jgi:hypothetical protein